jgi:hypothetical protein
MVLVPQFVNTQRYSPLLATFAMQQGMAHKATVLDSMTRIPLLAQPSAVNANAPTMAVGLALALGQLAQ